MKVAWAPQKIELSKGKTALVDADDFEFLNQWKWSYGSDGYAIRFENVGRNKRKLVLMHRILLKPGEKQQIDHKNGNRLDNTRDNLRTCDHSLNQRNKIKKPWFDKSRNKWRIAIRYYNGKRYSKRWDTYEQAIQDIKVKTRILQGIEARV
jgi:hypothetical protein